jgi:hypothetical protein
MIAGGQSVQPPGGVNATGIESIDGVRGVVMVAFPWLARSRARCDYGAPNLDLQDP